MRQYSHRCRRFRATLCLLAGGALAAPEKAAVENHLAACAGCGKYHDEVNLAATPLAGWEKAFSQLEASSTAQARWDRDFQAATAPARHRRPARLISILDWGRGVVWPCRRIWAGLAAVWVVILAADISMRAAGPSPRPSPAVLRAFLQGDGMQAEMTRLDERPAAEPQISSLPLPRSERPTGNSRV